MENSLFPKKRNEIFKLKIQSRKKNKNTMNKKPILKEISILRSKSLLRPNSQIRTLTSKRWKRNITYNTAKNRNSYSLLSENSGRSAFGIIVKKIRRIIHHFGGRRNPISFVSFVLFIRIYRVFQL